MCAPNKTKEGKKAFSYRFCTHLSITISAMVSGLSEFFFIKHEFMSMDIILEVFYRFNKMLIAATNTLRIIIFFLSVRQCTGTF